MQIHPFDNVEVRDNGHKYALKFIKKGENIIKYGSPIGHATQDIEIGEHVHTHNLKTNLKGNLEYTYAYKDYGIKRASTDRFFMGYVRENGDVGIRNDIWIVNTVGCVNKAAEAISKRTGAMYFSHSSWE
jgi:altronate hydrolase